MNAKLNFRIQYMKSQRNWIRFKTKYGNEIWKSLKFLNHIIDFWGVTKYENHSNFSVMIIDFFFNITYMKFEYKKSNYLLHVLFLIWIENWNKIY